MIESYTHADWDLIEKWTHSKNDTEKEIEICRATLIINKRPKLGDPVGIIEDVWTHEDYRKQGLASDAINQLLKKAKEKGCYKVVLDCADHNINFYERLSFEKWQNSMCIHIKNKLK